MKPIKDKYSDLPVSRQRKHQLRNPEKAKLARKRWLQTKEGKESVRLTNARQRAKRGNTKTES